MVFGEIYVQYVTYLERGREKADEAVFMMRQLPVTIVNADMEFAIEAAAQIIKGNDRQSNVVARLRGQNNGKILLLNGHMDVVAPTVIFGPGNEKLAHKADECVEIEHFVAAVPIFISIFKKLLG